MSKVKVTELKKCVLCGGECEDWIGGTGYGNNAQPLKEGKCCNTCNWTKVIPTRLNPRPADKR